MSNTIGIIAEDVSDVDVIKEILKKYLGNNFSIKKFVGNGCGKMRNKCDAWAKLLVRQGCEHIFIFHDRDDNCEESLRSELNKKVDQKTYPASLIVIPVKELEAWLLSDVDAISKAFNLKKTPKKSESINSPKEHLRDIVWLNNEKKRYVNTIHNKKIAEALLLDNLRTCRSFDSFDKYIKEKICA
jgi:hypothetical protein